MLKKILLLGFCLTVFWPAHALAQKSAPVTGETRAEIVAVLGSQLAAFGRDDGIEAFSYAAPGIRAQFGSVGNFMAMVKAGYGIVYRQQAHEFLETREWNGITAQAVRLIDFGCGNAYLTFAAYHYLQNILGKQAIIVGVDGQEKLIARNQRLAQDLGWGGLTFEQGLIIDYQTENPPNIVVALHACDTATDDTLAQGIRWQSQVIIAAPCCHHHLQVQLKERPSPPEFDAVLRYGLLHERLGDVLTDAFRAAILRMMGYQVTVMQFVSPDHTPKNLLLRAVKKDEGGGETAVAEYTQLQQYWQVEPYLAELLAIEL